jgi:hypothetical protein
MVVAALRAAFNTNDGAKRLRHWSLVHWSLVIPLPHWSLVHWFIGH